MNPRAKSIILYTTLVITGLYFLFWGLVKAKAFLAPLVAAALLAMIILPIARWLEKKGMNRGWSSLFSTLTILLFFVVLSGVISMQVKRFVEDWPQTKENLIPKIDQVQQFIEDKTGLSVQEQQQRVNEQIPGGESGDRATDTSSQGASQQTHQSSKAPSDTALLSSAGSFVIQLLSFIGTFLLTFIYVFFFLLYRTKFRKSIVKIAPQENRGRTAKVLSNSIKVSQNYLFGKMLLVIFLAVIYAIGLTVSGLQNALLIAILAAFLTLIPYLGNIIGFGLAVGLSFVSGNGLMIVLGVTITFTVTQFIESYIMEPYIVGEKVNLNPIFTIIVVVLGGAVWGVIGMLIAIPVLGISKVIFDNIPVLAPLGYLFGEEDTGNDGHEVKQNDPNFLMRIKRWAMNWFKKL